MEGSSWPFFILAEATHSSGGVDAGIVYWLLGGFLVWNYAHGRFSSEKAIRSSTTYARYIMASASYILAMLGIFGLLTSLIGAEQFLDLINELPVKFETDSESMRQTAPLLAALFLTAGLPHIGLLQRLDDALRGFCEKLGNVPWEAQSLANRLMTSEYFVPEATRPYIVEQTKNLIDEHSFAEQQTLIGKWLQVTALIMETGRWNESDNMRYLRFYSFFKSEHLDLEERWTWIRKGIKNKGSLEDFQAEIEKLRRQICSFVARGVLFAEISAQDRNKRLHEIGFKEVKRSARQFVTVHELTAVALLVFVVMMGSALMLGGGDEMGRQLRTRSLISLIYVCAVWAAIYPKAVSPLWRASEDGTRPWLFYVLAGLLAVALRFVIAFIFNIFTYGFDFLASLELTIWSSHYSVTAFVAAVGISVLADNWHHQKTPEPKWLRWAEGGALMVVFISASIAIQQWRTAQFTALPDAGTLKSQLLVIRADSPSAAVVVKNLQDTKTRTIKQQQEGSLGDTFVRLSMTGLIGFVLGAWLPGWYRRGMQINRKLEEEIEGETAMLPEPRIIAG